MMKRWQDTAKRLIDEMYDREYPQSVIETVRGAMLKNPDKTDEIDERVRACKTPKEAVKAVQTYLLKIPKKLSL